MKANSRNSLFVLALLMAGSLSAWAATTTWTTPVAIAVDADVSTTGTGLWAYDWNNSAQTVNGVAFTAPGSGVTAYGFYTSFTGFLTNTAAPATNLTAEYQAVLTGGNYSSGATACSVVLNNLTLGEQYQVQIWVNDSRSAGIGRTETLGSVTLDYNTTDLVGGLGQYTIGTFTADATSQTNTLLGSASTQINAIQLRDLGLPATALTPVFSPTVAGGKFLLAQTVTITSSPGSTVFYTVDGSNPNNTSTHGTVGGSFAQLVVPAPTNMTVKAYATNSAQADSAIGSYTYITYASPAVPTWINRNGGVWAASGNWSNAVMASGSGATADFTQMLLPANETISLGGARTVGHMMFADAGNAYGWTLTTNGTAGAFTLDATNSPTITVANQSTIIGLVMNGTNGFTKAGSGTLTLSNYNSYSGTTYVKAGTLQALARANGNDSAYVVTNGATLKQGYSTAGGYANTGMSIYGDGAAATTGFYLMGGKTYNVGSGFTIYNAPTTIRQFGTSLAALSIFDINSNPGLSCTAQASGSVVDPNIQFINGGYGMVITTAAGASNATGDLTLGGPLNVGTLGLYKRGNGSLRLNGAATTNNVAVRVQGGTVICGVTNCLGTNAALIVSSGATIDLNGFSQTVPTASLAGTVKMTINKGATPNSQVLTITDPNGIVYGGNLVVTSVGGAPALGDTFKLFDSPVGYNGGFTVLSLPDLPDTLGWSNALAFDGSIVVVPPWEPPTIAADPLPATSGVFAGSPFSFWGLSVQGAKPLSYQWQHAGTNLPGATASTFTKASATVDDAGDYQVVVTNQFGTATSLPCTLVVAPTDVTESFNYAPGTLSGQGPASGLISVWGQIAGGDNTVINPGATYSGPTTALTVSGNALFLAGNSADAGDDSSLPVTLGGNGRVYVGFIGQLTNNPGWGGVELPLSSTPQILLGANWQNQPWGWGDRGNFNAQNGHSTVPCSTQSFLVYRFDFTPTNALVKLYINPDLGTEPAVPTVSGTWSTFHFDSVRVIGHEPYPTGLIDELRLGGTWAAVTPHITVSKPMVGWSFSGTDLTLSWTSGTLQSATNVTGPWFDVPNATSPLVVHPQGPNAAPSQFYSLRQ
jgi:autotransporter-associated beta strand protein